MSVARTLGQGLLFNIVVPIVVLSGLATVIFLLSFLFSSEFRWFGFAQTLFFGAICWGSYRVLAGLFAKSEKLVKRINEEAGLQLNTKHVLGAPGPLVLAFDTERRQMAIGNTATGDYKLHGFDFIRSWQTDSKTVVRSEIGMGGAPIGNTILRGPTVTERQQETGFALVLNVADIDHPIIRIPMQSASRAEAWSARLEAMLNS